MLCYQLGVTNFVYQMLQKWSNVAKIANLAKNLKFLNILGFNHKI